MSCAPITIKGDNEQWDAVQMIQDRPFVYIMSNGSRWYKDPPGDIAELLGMLAKYALDVGRFGNGWNDDPCIGVRSEDGRGWVDGPRMYRVPVTRFFGNFVEYSHVFHIDTNHAPTIAALKDAIRANIARQQEQRKAA